MKEIKLPEQDFIDYEYDFLNTPLSISAYFLRNMTLEDLRSFFPKTMFLDSPTEMPLDINPNNLPIEESRKLSSINQKENEDWEKWLENSVMPLLEKENIAQRVRQIIADSLAELEILIVQEISNKIKKRKISVYLNKSNEKGDLVGKTFFEAKRGRLMPNFKANKGLISQKEEILKDYEEKALKILEIGRKLTLESLAEEVGKSTESIKQNLKRHWGISFKQFKETIIQKLKEVQK